MFYDQSQSVEQESELLLPLGCPPGRSGTGVEDPCNSEGGFPAPAFEPAPGEASEDRDGRTWEARGRSSLFSGYDREVIARVWEFAEAVPGVDSELWRLDEFGSWIRRLDHGRRDSAFGWEVFDPGIGRSSQGVYAMRPMHWQNYLRQHEAFV